NPGSKDYDGLVSARVRQALNSNDPGDVAAAISVTFPSRDRPEVRAPYPYLPEFSKWISSPHEAVRKQARNLAGSLDAEDASRVVEGALAVLNDDSQKKHHIEA